MNKLDLNAYGVSEISLSEKINADAGYIDPQRFIDFLAKAFQGIVEDNKNNPYGQK